MIAQSTLSDFSLFADDIFRAASLRSLGESVSGPFSLSNDIASVVRTVASAMHGGRVAVFKLKQVHGAPEASVEKHTTVENVVELRTWIGLEVVDAHDTPCAGVEYTIALSGGRERSGTTDAHGRAREEDIHIGTTARVRLGKEFPDGVTHTVQTGECAHSIAARYGHTRMDDVWQHSRNEALRDARHEPGVLLEGDKVFVPSARRASEAIETGQYNRIVLRAPTCHVAIKVMDGDDKHYAKRNARVRYGKTEQDTTTNDEGMIAIELPATVMHAEVLVWLSDESETETNKAPHADEDRDGVYAFALHVGALDPYTTVSGVQQRLANVGCFRGVLSGTKCNETERAVREFQLAQGMEADGEIDADTVKRLCEAHGCEFNGFKGMEETRAKGLSADTRKHNAPRVVAVARRAEKARAHTTRVAGRLEFEESVGSSGQGTAMPQTGQAATSTLVGFGFGDANELARVAGPGMNQFTVKVYDPRRGNNRHGASANPNAATLVRWTTVHDDGSVHDGRVGQGESPWIAAKQKSPGARGEFESERCIVVNHRDDVVT